VTTLRVNFRMPHRNTAEKRLLPAKESLGYWAFLEILVDFVG